MKKGFTLVELLAVIVILAIILAIAIPGISGIVKSATRGAFQSDAKMILKAIEYKLLEDETFDPSVVNETNVKSLLKVGDENYQSLTVKKIDNVLYVSIIGKNKWQDLSVSGTKTMSIVSNTVTSLIRGANTPVLASGMTPIKWNGTAWVTTTQADTAWYNYDTSSKIWANAKTEDGSMWVWIPRYIYKISSGWHTSVAGTVDVQFTKGIDDNWNKAVIGNINLDETSTASNNTWTNHPAFTFGDTELTGIWVAKFEASGTTSEVKFLPNVTSLRSLTVGDMFTASLNIQTNTIYGWGTAGNNIDTHLMKNSEWGAVVYLAKSVYGKNTEIWMNNSSSYTTGCAGSNASSSAYAGCENAYNTTNGVQASTTGNIYGIYDFAGGAWEYVASYVNNAHANLGNGSVILNADNKYRDVYTKGIIDDQTNNHAITIDKKGDSMYETSLTGADATSWNADFTLMPRIEYPWFIRGGGSGNVTYAGTFAFYYSDGAPDSYFSFRSVVLAGEGL